MPYLRYALTMAVTVTALQTVASLLNGDGPMALVTAVLGFLWIGWIIVIVGLPFFAVLRWALPRAFRRFASAPRPLVGLATGFAVWAVIPSVVMGIASLLSETPPGESPQTPLGLAVSLVGFGLVIGGIGALLGLIEARFSPALTAAG